MSKRISKMLFSKEKVELSSINDLESVQKQYFNTFDNVRDVRKIGVELKKKAQSSLSDLNKVESKINQELKSFEQAAKDLGVDIKGVKIYQELKDIVNKSIPDYKRIFKQAMAVDTL